MSDQQILEKAIQRAIDGGWKHSWGELKVDENGSVFVFIKQGDRETSVRVYGAETSLKEIIFSHDFARALWGGLPFKELRDEPTYKVATLNWQFHLQQMVISEDPIKYLGEHI